VIRAAALTSLAAFVLAFVLTALVRRHAVAHGVLDIPNDRSSHRVPTPRGGGIAIALSTIAASTFLLWRGALDVPLYLALTGGGIVVAFVGYLDDRRPLSARIRLAAHLAAALWALVCLGGLPPMRFGDHIVSLGWAGYVVGALGIAWTVNLFNFMDGIDGIAASEAISIAWGAVLLALVMAQAVAMSAMAMAFGAVCCGFLVWNWPPAKIFMGDVGSGYLGYVLVVLALGASRGNPTALAVWVILGGVFFCDAFVTLMRRLARGERVYQAHRSHAYQYLARCWGNHRSVTLAVVCVNLLWLLPCAWWAAARPGIAGWIVLVAFLPLVLVVLVAGAGRRADTE
jgi:Fuc2NAc and GlcNAc transferase